MRAVQMAPRTCGRVPVEIQTTGNGTPKKWEREGMVRVSIIITAVASIGSPWGGSEGPLGFRRVDAGAAPTMFDRDGLLALMKSAQRREFQAVITECPDRLSRDIEDLPAILKD
jgi:hypothetical protein